MSYFLYYYCHSVWLSSFDGKINHQLQILLIYPYIILHMTKLQSRDFCHFQYWTRRNVVTSQYQVPRQVLTRDAQNDSLTLMTPLVFVCSDVQLGLKRQGKWIRKVGLIMQTYKSLYRCRIGMSLQTDLSTDLDIKLHLNYNQKKKTK